MRKIIPILLMITMLLSLFLGCQPTPEEPIVISKDQQQMIGKAQETVAPNAAEPVTEHVQESFSEHGVSVEVDANVTIPYGEMPIIRVHGINFAQETVDRFWDVLIGDTTMYDLFDEAGKETNAALNTRDDGVTLLIAAEHPNGEWWKKDGKYFNVLNNRETPYGKGKPLNYDATLCYRFAYSFEEFFEDASDRQPITERSAVSNGVNLNMTPDEAMRRATEWIERLDVPFTPMRVTAVRNEAKQDAYLIECARVVNGVPIAVTDGYSRLDPKTSVTVDWYYESFKILLSDEDLLALQWESPIEKEDTVVENSSLLPFDKVMDVFRTMMPIRYAASYEDRSEVYAIGDIRLELVRVLEQNVQNSGLLVPVWCFYGTNREEAKNGSNYQGVEIYGCWLMINAIDGSIIDPQKGY